MIEGRRFIALLPVGGAGTRLWPVSNETTPKQFLRLLGDRSLFQATAERLERAPVDRIAIVTGAAHAEHARSELNDLGKTCEVLIEPCRRDSAAAIAAGTAWVIREAGPDCILAVLPADHFIPDRSAFADAMIRAARLAVRDWIVTLSIKPTEPTPEYGYIERGAGIGEAQDAAFAVRRFHEKPSRNVAETYVANANFGWNSGIFVFRAGLFRAEAETHMPDIWKHALAAVEKAHEERRMLRLDKASFEAAPRRSLDHALMEKSERVATIPVDFAWRDIGNWASVYDALAADRNRNVLVGDVAADETSGSLVYADGVPIKVHGVTDLIVVASKSGVFVAPREKAAEIKRLLEQRSAP